MAFRADDVSVLVEREWLYLYIGCQWIGLRGVERRTKGSSFCPSAESLV